MASFIFDYGHGQDTWKNGGGKGVRHGGRVYEEHNFNVDVGERTRKIVEAYGVKVFLSQPAGGNDRSLASRTNLAKKVKADMFVSFHANGGVPQASGACVFAWKGATNSNKMADLVVKHMKAQGIATHGNGRHYSEHGSWTNFHVLRVTAEANLPAVLIEHGFMTNSSDFENIFGKNKNAYIAKCALANAKALLEYVGIKYDSGKSKEIAKDIIDWKAYKPTPEDYKRGRIGRVKITAEGFLNFRAGKSLDSKVLKELPSGRIYSAYEKDGKWFNLGNGWASAGSDGSLLEFAEFPPQPKEPKKTVYRVIVNGEQVGAYSEGDNVLEQIEKAMGHLEDDISIEKV